MSLQIHYPFKPFQITQAWGALNPAYSEQFNNPDFKRHNGVDARAGYYTWVYKDGKLQKEIATEYLVFCPVDGFKVTEVAYYKQGGGNQIGLTSKEKIQIGDKLCYVSILLCHAKKILAKVGDEPRVGELIMVADNTGFSTGLHTHMGMYRLNDKYQKLDSNEATGSYDPSLCFTGKYAVDEASLIALGKSALTFAQYYVGIR